VGDLSSPQPVVEHTIHSAKVTLGIDTLGAAWLNEAI
jgi:hypothetical protein